MDRNSEKKKSEIPAHGDAKSQSQLLFDQFQAGESEAATLLFDRYVVRLIALARSRISQGMKRRIDPEDIIQSAYRSFFVRAAEGTFELRESGDLWRLLSQITLNKVRSQGERHYARRRDIRREEAFIGTATNRVPQPTAEEAAALVEQLRLIAERLSGDERFTLTAYLQGDTIDEIAERLAKSPRTVRRALARARALIERQILPAAKGAFSPPEIPPLDTPLPYSDYRLERMIGIGGMGKVYRATQLDTGETVAVKALRKDRQSDERAVRQFLHEAQVVSGLNHPGIIRVRGLGRFPAGGYFLVMDWIEGTDLQAVLDKQLMSSNERIKVVEAVAEAVRHSHEAGIVHCDLKPANILLGHDNRVVVTDFGFAQLVSGGEKRMAIGGTRGYLAPELLDASGTPTAASDVYSLGKILEQVTQGVSRSLIILCEHCLAPDPAMRPSTVASFLRQLQKAMANQS